MFDGVLVYWWCLIVWFCWVNVVWVWNLWYICWFFMVFVMFIGSGRLLFL